MHSRLHFFGWHRSFKRTAILIAWSMDAPLKNISAATRLHLARRKQMPHHASFKCGTFYEGRLFEMERILVCVAWPYANGPLHVGHVTGSILPADIFARFNRMVGNEVIIVSGSDMHGAPITVLADKEKISPEEVANRNHTVNSKAILDMGFQYA